MSIAKKTNNMPLSEDKEYKYLGLFDDELDQKAEAYSDADNEVRIKISTLESIVLKVIRQVHDAAATAYGDCENCYGKGYSTQLEFSTGRGKRFQEDYYLPCEKCERGKQIKEMMQYVQQTERGRITEHPAFEALQDYKQADEDGVMVKVSRQAIDEVVNLLTNHD